VKVAMLDVGAFSSPAGVWRRGEDAERWDRFPVPAYVIEAGRERILVDTGLHPAAVADPAAHYDGAESLRLFRLEQEASVAERVDLATVTGVVITHLHFDHAGGLALLPPALPIAIQRREWEAAHEADAVARNFYLPRDYEGIGEEQLELVDGDHDLLGDGSIRLLATPGHTPGHQSVLVGERLLLAADVIHFAATLDDRRFPLFADDPEAQERSADRLRALREAGVTVRPGHDPALELSQPVVFGCQGR
jgi:glyoxylase-like metal-dependent hydrolase (beta-lactamase superfamily II)